MILPTFIIIPLLAAFLIVLCSGRRDRVAVVISLAASASLAALSVVAFVGGRGGTAIYAMGGWKVPLGISLLLDPLSGFMLVMVSLITLTSILFSIAYIRHLEGEAKYYALLMILVAGMNGVILTSDLFNLFVFVEISLFAAFALVAYGGRAHEFEAAFKYTIMGSISSSLILFAIAVVYSSTSALSMSAIAAALPQKSPVLIVWAGGLFVAGFGLKAAAMPFHAWLPDAHSSAPAPVSAMLSGLLIKTLGVYALIRVFFNIMGAPPLFLQVFLVLGVVSILVGNILAVGQWDIKRLLAYSSIGQIGYILLAVGLGTPLGMAGAIFHMINHAIFKSLLFYNSGALEAALGTRDLRQMGNVSKLLPVTAHTSMVASLSIAGIPPFNGFFSKLLIIIAAVQAGQPLYALAAVVGSLFTIAAFMKVQRYGLRSERPAGPLQMKVSWGMNAAMIVLALLCVVTSLMIVPGIREVTLDPAVRVVMEKAQLWLAVFGK